MFWVESLVYVYFSCRPMLHRPVLACPQCVLGFRPPCTPVLYPRRPLFACPYFLRPQSCIIISSETQEMCDIVSFQHPVADPSLKKFKEQTCILSKRSKFIIVVGPSCHFILFPISSPLQVHCTFKGWFLHV